MNTLLFKSKTDKVSVALFGLFAILMIASLYQIAYGRSTDLRSDMVTEDASAVDNVAVHMELPALTAATSTVLVDLSDTTNFPHDFTGAIEISQIRVEWSSLAAVASTTVKFGVLASTTNQGKTDIYWFDRMTFSTQMDSVDVSTAGAMRSLVKTINYAPSVMSLALSSGAPSKFLSNDTTLFTTAYATTSSLQSPRGSANSLHVFPAAGDLVMSIEGQSAQAAATTSVTVLYRIR